jgi:hypothetical protein
LAKIRKICAAPNAATKRWRNNFPLLQLPAEAVAFAPPIGAVAAAVPAVFPEVGNWPAGRWHQFLATLLYDSEKTSLTEKIF